MPNISPTPTYEFITGNAGSGKTYTLKKRIEECRKLGNRNLRSYGTLTATTGIASINLSGGTGDTVCTLNSCLKYFDTNSLKDNFASRKLHNALKEISRAGRNLIIDEVSMMDAQQLDLIYDALQEVNELQEVFNRGGLGLILSGDFAQLPPVKAEFCFNAKCWSKFQVTKLDKIWRQNDPVFMEALNAARQGDGGKCANLLCSIGGVKLLPITDSHFDGTTIVPVNKLVDSINKIRLDELLRDPANRQFEFKSFRWGRQHPEWKGIPESRIVCKNAYIMILANDSPVFTYANGSCGHIVDANIDNGSVIVKLKDGGREVKVRKVTRCYYTKDIPIGCQEPEFLGKGEWLESEHGSLWSDSTNELKAIQYKQYLVSLTESLKKPYQPYYNFLEEKWVIGEISYTPIRLAYASTVHKCVSTESLVVSKSSGIQLASNVLVGEHIFDGDEYVEIIGRAFREDKCICIKTRRGLESIISYEHPVLTFSNGFIQAQHLNVGNWIKVGLDYKLKQKHQHSDNLYWLLGALVGDGSYTDDKEGNVYFSNSNLFLLDKMKRIVECDPTLHFGIRSDKRGGFFTSKPFRQKLFDLGLDYVTARDKEVPSSVLTSGKAAICNFLTGLMDTDGSVYRSGVVITMVGKKLAEQVLACFLAIGIPASKGFYETAYGDYYQVRVSADGIRDYKYMIGFSKPDKVDRLAQCCPNRIINPWTGYDEVVSVEKTELVYPLVNFQTRSGRFMCDGIVTHNSQGLSLDSVQIDYSHAFFGEPSMSYVALSRCRTPEGLTIVGSKHLIEMRTNISSEILDWV